MQHTAHTPGPWFAHTLPDGSHHIMAEHWGASVAVTMYPDNGAEGRESNARLIAAAPDMLRTLEFVLSDLNSTLDAETALIVQHAINQAKGA